MSKPSTLIKIDFGDAALVPNNVFGRFGARVYRNSMDGFFVFMTAIIALFVGTPMILGGLHDGLPAVTVIGLLFVALALIVGPATLYARLSVKKAAYAWEIADARDSYRRLDHFNKEMAKPLMDKIDLAVKNGSSTGIAIRLRALDRFLDVVSEEKVAVADDSDIDRLNEYSQTILEVQRKFKI